MQGDSVSLPVLPTSTGPWFPPWPQYHSEGLSCDYWKEPRSRVSPTASQLNGLWENWGCPLSMTSQEN